MITIGWVFYTYSVHIMFHTGGKVARFLFYNFGFPLSEEYNNQIIFKYFDQLFEMNSWSDGSDENCWFRRLFGIRFRRKIRRPNH